MGVKNHRLSLRKNLRPELFEVYRKYSVEKEEAVFQESLDESLKAGDGEYVRLHSFDPHEMVCECPNEEGC